MIKKRFWLVLLTLGLFLLAAWLMSPEWKPSSTKEKKIDFPSRLRDHEWERLKKRQRNLMLKQFVEGVQEEAFNTKKMGVGNYTNGYRHRLE